MASSDLPAQLAALMTPAAYRHPVRNITVITTHMSWVLLTGDFAYKIKRPVHYAFVDMRQAQTRRHLCEEELRLNRRFAPELYLGLVAITVAAGSTHVDGPGDVIEYAVRMRQFAPSAELASLLTERTMAPHALEAFGRALAEVHAQLPCAVHTQAFGQPDFVRQGFVDNLTQLDDVSSKAGQGSHREAFGPALQRLLDCHHPAMAERHASGQVRECHGDLHCRNLVQYSGRLLAFDCLEFEPSLRWIDVGDEVSFLWMDLKRRGGAPHAAAFLNAWLQTSGDYGATRLLAMYGAHRALVRAKVALLEASAVRKDEVSTHACDDYRAYVACASEILSRRTPALILMNGLSGSGKTWLAERLARVCGAIHVRSDIERKRLVGLHSRSRTDSAVGQGLYQPDLTALTYGRLADCASDALAGGFSVIVDATFQKQEDRAHFARLAAKAHVPLAVVRCRAPDSVQEQRIRERIRAGSDASEADIIVRNWQRDHFEEIDRREGLLVIDAETTRDTVVSEVESRLQSALC